MVINFLIYDAKFAFSGEITYLPKDASIPITLKTKEFEVFTVVPVIEVNGLKCAPIGLMKMFNSGGAIKELNCVSNNNGTTTSVVMKVRGCGLFGAYSSAQPTTVTVDSEEVEFRYEEESGLVSIDLRVPEKELYQWNISINY